MLRGRRPVELQPGPERSAPRTESRKLLIGKARPEADAASPQATPRGSSGRGAPAAAPPTRWERCPGLLPVARTVCRGSTRHYWPGAAGDDAAPVDATRGVDQGCPLSPALYAIGTASALETLLARLRALDPQAAVMAYLDDTYVVVAHEHAGRALELVRELFGPRGLELNLTKTKIWVPNGNTDDLDTTAKNKNNEITVDPIEIPLDGTFKEILFLSLLMLLLLAIVIGYDINNTIVKALIDDPILTK